MDQEYCPYCMNPVEKDTPCPACGLTAGAYAPSPHHLPPGTILRERYLVGRVLGEGGFGITYIGCDLRLELKVAIKEYFPTDRANRVAAASLEVSSYSGAAGERYESGKARFLQEARTMARMDKQPVIVSVRDFFELHNTAYIVMEYVEGTTFKDLVVQRGGRIPAGELLHIIEPLFSALGAMHRQGLIHRDISPENLMLENGDVRLLDFGCARESADGEATMTIALKHGYAPVEQYQNKGQGSWTDVYALSATIYYCITGRKPPQSMDRLVEDELVMPRKLGVDLTRRQEQALVYGMGVRPRRRFQSVEELHAALYEGILPQGLDLPELPATGERERVWEPPITPAIEAEPVDMTAAGPVTAEDPKAATHTQTQTQTHSQTQAQTAEEPPAPAPGGDPAWLKWIKAHWPIAAGAGAAAVALIALLIWHPWAGPSNADDPSPTQTLESQPGSEATGEPEPTQEDGSYSMLARSWSQLAFQLESGNVGGITVPSDTWFDAEEPVVLTKTLRIEQNAGMGFLRGLTIAEGGRLEIAGSLDALAMIRTMGGGTIEVESGGSMGTHMLWLEHEGDFICAPDGRADIWGGNRPDALDDYGRSHYLVLDEDELFANTVHVNSEEEFAQHFEGDTPIVIDSDITFTQPYWVRVPVLIPEGVTVDAPCPDPGRDEGNCTLEMCEGTRLVNYGTIKGRLALHCGQGEQGQMNPSYFVNFGTVDANLWTELSAVINLGDITTQETLNQTALANLGSLTIGGLLEMQGNWSANAGTITMPRNGDLTIYGGTGWNDYGEVVVEDGGAFWNYATFFHNSGAFTVRPGGTLGNYGVLEANAAPLSVESGATLFNDGLVTYRGDALRLNSGPSDGEGRIIALDGGSGDRTRYVSSESELRSALEDGGCDLVIWNGYDGRSKININGGELVVTKGLILNSSEDNPVDLNSGGVTVTGEGAFLFVSDVDYHGNGLTVEQGAAASMGLGAPRSLNRVDVSGGGLVLLNGGMSMENSGISVSGGGRLVEIGGVQMNGGAIRIDGDGRLDSFGGLELHDCEVVNSGSLIAYFSGVYQDGGSLINNGEARFSGWDHMVNLSGDVSNHGELTMSGGFQIHGTLINEADGSVTLDRENVPLQVFGRLENRGVIRAAQGAYVETVEGGTFTGNQAEPLN